MSSQYVRDQFRESWPILLPGIPLLDTVNADPNHKDSPDLWCTVDFYGPNEDAVSLGEPSCRREDGVIEVTISVKAGTGDSAMSSAAESIRNAYRYWKAGGLKVDKVDPPVPEKGASDGTWYLAGIDISYTYDNYI